MKLTEIQVRQFRCFRKGLDVVGLDAGLTVFHGPNESGKSTLAHAIRTAFFERHGAGTHADLLPWGDSGATPEVRLRFEFDGRSHHLVKRFVRSRSCDLNIEGQRLDGDEAEQYLASLAGFTVPERGTSKAEHWGVPGLLWIQQGTGHQLAESVQHAHGHLQGVLSDAMGHVASSDGDRVLQRVSEQLGQLQTRTGAPRLEYRKALELQQHLRQQLDSLEDTIHTYRQHVDELAGLQVRHRRDAAEQPWLEMRRKEQDSQEQLARANAMRDELKREHDALKTCMNTQKLLQQQLQTFSQHAQNLKTREHERAREHERHQTLSGQTAGLQQAVDAATTAYARARDALALSRQVQQQQDKQRQLTQLQEELSLLRERLDQAKEAHVLLDADQKRASSLRIAAKDLEKLRAVHEQLQSLQIRRQAIATRVEFDLLPGQTLDLDGIAISGTAEHLLLEPAALTIPGVGAVRITPGGEDVSGLVRDHERLQEEWARQLQALDVTSLEHARQKMAEHVDLTARIQHQQTVLKMHAPDGLEALDARCQHLEAQLQGVQREYAALPQVPCNADDIALAQVTEQAAEGDLKQAEAQLQAHRVAIATASAGLDAAQREYELAKQAMEDKSRVDSEQQALLRLNEERARAATLDDRIATLQEQIDAVRPDILEQDIARYGQSATRTLEEHAERERTLRELKGRLQAWGAQGLEEEQHALAAELAVASRRVDEFFRNAQALSLLHGLLTEKRQTLTRQLHAPLKKRLMHYLGVLFSAPDGGVNIVLGDDLMPVSLERQDEQAGLQDLSFGAREQMGLISRLAYADLLKDAGQPTLIMLDDALVHSDDTRLAHMKRILFDAAQRHQILLFTCHPEKWRDMGVAPRAIQDLLI